ncbi:MAG: SDR family oxidoreductase [Akkermansiaceae bacterium]|nr:SDR family oxidoreductase [Akkermansiaceae bacterium]MCF7732119.1 SDR family oxidoreductase [Akkermansiaceae bacterium]
MQHLVITGGSGGLGSAIAEAFRNPQWNIAAPGRRELDVADPAAIAAFFSNLPVDLLVCAAGLTGEQPLARLPESIWDEVLAVNFTGAAACARAVLPGMIARGSGHLLFVSSFSALHPPPGLTAYATAKAALLGLTRDLAARHGAQGVRVNAILPGFLETRMTREVTSRRRAAVLAEHTLGAFNTPQAAAGFIHFLHHHLPHTSGQHFQLDSRLGS